MHQLWIQEFRNVNSINPKDRCWSCYFDIKHHEFMIRCVVNTFLDSLWSFNNGIRMFLWPWTSKILSVYLDDGSFWINFLDFVKDVIHMIMNFLHCISCIVESFCKVFPWVFTGNRDLLGEEISSSSISCNFISTIIVYWKVGSVDLLRCNPKDIRRIMTFLLDFLNEPISSGQFNWWILFESKFELDLFFLHNILSLNLL